MCLRSSLIKAARYAADVSENLAAQKMLESEACARLTDDQLLDLTLLINRQMNEKINAMLSEQVSALKDMT